MWIPMPWADAPGIMWGTAGAGWSTWPCNAENGFVPPLPDKPVDVVYLCYPNNPTGTVLTKAQLKVFVDWAKENGAIIIYDAAYRAYVTIPKSR